MGQKTVAELRMPIYNVFFKHFSKKKKIPNIGPSNTV